MPAEGKNKVLKITKGEEQRVRASNDIRCRKSLMYPAFCEAVHALKEILTHTKLFYEETKNISMEEYDNYLFQYCSNIIAFLAVRGGGKTRTMLSFAQILQAPTEKPECLEKGCQLSCGGFLFDKEDQELNDCTFSVLSPIAPSSLEGSQNILYVVLTRLHRYAEKLLLEDRQRNYISEYNKNELLFAFQRCLSGINGIKHPPKEGLDDLSNLQEIADGLSLRKNFYLLIKKLLEVANPRSDVENRFLVIQMDDADTQIASGFDVLEDVRKYLLIPNLIILLSADSDSLQKVVLQNQLHQFKDIPRECTHFVADLVKGTRKYMDKLIPASHAIYLPNLEQIIAADSDRTILRYVSGEKEEEPEWLTGSGWDLQNTILTMIYRKTGVAFAVPDAYMHNIIPRTMRGLTQLIHLLSTMEDIPFLTADLAEWKVIEKAILEQISVTEHNLRLFTDYFENDWIETKIGNSEDREFLKALSKTTCGNRVFQANDYLHKRYDAPEKENPKNSNPKIFDRYHLDELMRTIEEKNRTLADFHLLFAIRTLLTLESNRLIQWQKRIAISDYNERMKDGVSRKLIYNFDSEIIVTPQYYFSSEYVKNLPLNEGKSKVYTEFFFGKPFTPSDEAMLFFIRNQNGWRFSLMNFIQFLLKPQEDWNKLEGYTQLDFLAIQEYALAIAANWDVQKNLYHKLRIAVDTPKDRSLDTAECLVGLLTSTSKILQSINDGRIVAQNPLLEHFLDKELLLKVPNQILQYITEVAENTVEQYKKLQLTSANNSGKKQGKQNKKAKKDSSSTEPTDMPEEYDIPE